MVLQNPPIIYTHPVLVIAGATGMLEERFKKIGSHSRKTFNRLNTKDIYIWNITDNTESIAVRNLKAEQWGSALVHEKYREEEICYKRQHKQLTN